MLLVNAREIASLLGINRYTALRWAAEGRIPSMKVGRLRRFDADLVLEFLKNGGPSLRNGQGGTK